MRPPGSSPRVEKRQPFAPPGSGIAASGLDMLRGCEDQTVSPLLFEALASGALQLAALTAVMGAAPVRSVQLGPPEPSVDSLAMRSKRWEAREPLWRLRNDLLTCELLRTMREKWESMSEISRS